jgi:hypothetical protein
MKLLLSELIEELFVILAKHQGPEHSEVPPRCPLRRLLGQDPQRTTACINIMDAPTSRNKR